MCLSLKSMGSNSRGLGRLASDLFSRAPRAGISRRVFRRLTVEVGVSIDPAITQLGYCIWYDNTAVCADLFEYKTRGTVSERSIRIAQAFASWLEYDWTNQLSWVAVEDQIIRPRSPYNQAIMTLKTAADTVSAVLLERFGSPEIVRYLPETWKGSMSKQSTEMHITGDHFKRPGRLRPEELLIFQLPECYTPFRERTQVQKKRASDVFDAVGIGLRYLGRF